MSFVRSCSSCHRFMRTNGKMVETWSALTSVCASGLLWDACFKSWIVYHGYQLIQQSCKWMFLWILIFFFSPFTLFLIPPANSYATIYVMPIYVYCIPRRITGIVVIDKYSWCRLWIFLNISACGKRGIT